jgi:hypothetical protein
LIYATTQIRVQQLNENSDSLPASDVTQQVGGAMQVIKNVAYIPHGNTKLLWAVARLLSMSILTEKIAQSQ